MQEPIYSYVRGQGWVIRANKALGERGPKFIIELRKPNYGERFTWTMVPRERNSNDRFFTNGEPDQGKWENWAETNRLSISSFEVRRVESDYDDSFLAAPNRFFVTVVPVE